MKVAIETITPKMAEQYLLSNTRNRSLKKQLISQYARDMQMGKWRLTHQGLAFNCDGTLLDGQHRLRAIVESGATVQMLVTRGVESQAQLVMDDHAKRSAGDALTLLRGERVSENQVAIVRAAVELSVKYRADRATKTELNDLVDQFRNPLDFAAEFLVGNRVRGVHAASTWAAICLSWFYVDNLERLRDFCRILCAIDMPFEDSDRAACLLRDWLLRTGVRYASQRVDAFCKTQRAVVAFMKYQELQKLIGTSQHYPWPLVDPVRR